MDDFREERRARGAAGRQARLSGQCPDLSTDKSGKKQRARHATTESSKPHHALSRQGRRGGCDGRGGRGWIGERKVNARRQPLESKRPGSCSTAGGASFAQPRSPQAQAAPPAGKPPQGGQRLPQNRPHKGHPMTFRRLPWGRGRPGQARPRDLVGPQKAPPSLGGNPPAAGQITGPIEGLAPNRHNTRQKTSG